MSQQTALSCVVGRFPSREELISDLYLTDQVFHSLCEDYCECLESLARWTGKTGENAAVYQQDYRELLSDLEAEIVKYADRRQSNADTRI